MTENKQIQFNMITNNKIPYIKVDLSKSCRLADNYAISFFQFDYQELANRINVPGESPISQIEPIIKVVMDYNGFVQFKNEINALFSIVESEKIKAGL